MVALPYGPAAIVGVSPGAEELDASPIPLGEDQVRFAVTRQIAEVGVHVGPGEIKQLCTARLSKTEAHLVPTVQGVTSTIEARITDHA